ncbi:alkaline phosphatase PhoX [Luteipulveratus halotolerans]|uniref:Phosphatase n=1 Tax=Luteipulveratus halotolerans TaxID=1631356 RepID=A0A0L6CKD1_9MICO|nr:alkaline phosphatase PhoX [Luteipulveratus halotolerans]KNX38261.1 phosphatase [Luteipulveratus halotolerans]
MTDMRDRTPTPEPARGIDRRTALRGGLAALAALGPLQALGARTAGAAPMAKAPFSPDYGPLAPVKDHTTGLELLRLPKGFEYISHGWTGDPMTGGAPTPGAHDGMGTFTAPDGKTVIVRNHELSGYTGAFGGTAAYDPAARGGTTTVVFDRDAGQFLGTTPSLAGTIRNCAGGVTPWGSWLSCEETTEIGPDGTRHGYVFEVPADGQSNGVPLKQMGRFSHEAVCVDPSTDIVYLTEDATPSGFYRFLPHERQNLAAGGELQMMVIGDSGQSYVTYDDPTGTSYRTSWVTIDNPDYAPGEVRPALQGQAKGAAVFKRLEGAWWGNDRAYVVSTSGGPKGQGQVFEYDPATETMTVLFASPDATVLNNPDNICVSPRGGIVLCEDGDAGEYLHGLTQDGQIFPFALNQVVIPAGGVPGKSVKPGDYSGSEWCGSAFDTVNGNWLFANAQTPGITFAITGPWRTGSL